MKIKYVFFAVLLLCFFTPVRGVMAQSANYQQFYAFDRLDSAQPQWHYPTRLLGLSDGNVATISAVGYPGLFTLAEAPAQVPYTTLTAVKFDIVAKNVSNLSIAPTINLAQPPGCSGKTVSAGSTLGHNYLTFTTTECPGMTMQDFYDHAFGYKLTYYYGAQNVSATIDSITVMPIFTDSPWDTGVVNTMPIYQTPGSIPDVSQSAYDDLILALQGRVPWAYIYALSTLDLGTPATSSAIPDFHLNYESKYKGVEVFNYDFLVRGADLPNMDTMRNTLRTVISVVMWVGVIWYFSKHWRVLFQQ